MDRGIFVADPVAAGGSDSRELGYYVAVVHDVCRYGFIGFRYDSYDPNSDFLDKRKGKLLPASQTVTTLSPLVGFQLPGHAKLSAQYDFVDDSQGRDDQGVPTDRANNAWTIRLQGEL